MLFIVSYVILIAICYSIYTKRFRVQKSIVLHVFWFRTETKFNSSRFSKKYRWKWQISREILIEYSDKHYKQNENVIEFHKNNCNNFNEIRVQFAIDCSNIQTNTSSKIEIFDVFLRSSRANLNRKTIEQNTFVHKNFDEKNFRKCEKHRERSHDDIMT